MTRRLSRVLSALLLCSAASGAGAVEAVGRLKGVVNWLTADNRDAVARLGTDPAYSVNLDARLTLSDGFRDSNWRWEVAGEITTLQGDVVENGALFRGQNSGEASSLPGDDTRAAGLTWLVSDGKRHGIVARLDRAQVVWQRDRWRARIGRQALSLGSGLVFNPMDLFNPFAPTATDRDFKPGDDALLVSRLGDDGSEVELLAVFRREVGDTWPTGDVGSYGVRYRAAAGLLEYEIVATRHFDSEVLAASLSGPIGGSVWRMNWVGTRHDDKLTTSLVANIDYAFGFRDQPGYAFLEYYYNGFGDDDASENPALLDDAALERLGRGELFTLERHYLAAGVTLQFNPLLTLNATSIFNLHDGAPLVQASFSYNPGDNQTFEVGAIIPTGGKGNEFGGVIVEPLTPILTGTSSQYYARLVWFL